MTLKVGDTVVKWWVDKLTVVRIDGDQVTCEWTEDYVVHRRQFNFINLGFLLPVKRDDLPVSEPKATE